MGEQELKNRTKAFALRVMKLVGALPDVEEADETCYWLELIIEGLLLPANLVEPLLQEANEVTAIMVASRKTADAR